VIEHMPLGEGLDRLQRMTALLGPGGVLIVQTPNARGIRNPLGRDMTPSALLQCTRPLVILD